MKKDCHEVAKRINDLIRQCNIDFEIVWQSRETEEIRFDDKILRDFKY